MYAGEHEFAIVSPADYPAIDGSRYAAVASELAGAGFRRVGTIEDATVSAVYPHNRTYVESHVSADGEISASTYWVAGRQIVDLATVLGDGRVLVTTNADIDKMTPPPSVRRDGMPAATAPAALLARHRERLAALRSPDRPLRIVRSDTLDDVIVQARQVSRLMAEYRQSIGLLTESELMAMIAPGQEATGKRVWREFTALTGRS